MLTKYLGHIQVYTMKYKNSLLQFSRRLSHIVQFYCLFYSSVIFTDIVYSFAIPQHSHLVHYCYCCKPLTFSLTLFERGFHCIWRMRSACRFVCRNKTRSRHRNTTHHTSPSGVSQLLRSRSFVSRHYTYHTRSTDEILVWSSIFRYSRKKLQGRTSDHYSSSIHYSSEVGILQ